jgi:RNA polymerase sigma factor (sigma-70 family)
MTVYNEIFEDFKRGDMNSFYKVMYPELLAFAVNFIGKDYQYLAEDCVQDSVFKTYVAQQRTPFESCLHWKNYLYICIRNEVISILRKDKAMNKYLANRDTDQFVTIQFIEQETRTLLYNAVESLPDKYREIFKLSFDEGLKNKEIAELLKVKDITVKKRKAAMLKLLRKKLNGTMDEKTIMLLFVCLQLKCLG